MLAARGGAEPTCISPHTALPMVPASETVSVEANLVFVQIRRGTALNTTPCRSYSDSTTSVSKSMISASRLILSMKLTTLEITSIAC